MFLKNYNPWATNAHGFGWSDKSTDIVSKNGYKCSELYSPSLGITYTLYDIMNTFPIDNYIDINDGEWTQGTYGVIFGTGNAAPTVDDHWLSGERIAGLNSSNITITRERTGDNEKRQIAYEYTIHNTLGEAITIGEVALANYFQARKTSDGSNHIFFCIIERTALAAPITIEPDGVGQVHYTVQMNYPIV